MPQSPLVPYRSANSSSAEVVDILWDTNTEQIVTCGICFDRFHVSTLAAFADWIPLPDITTLPCRKRHSYCFDCLRAYLHSALEVEPILGVDRGGHGRTSLSIPCPGCASSASTSAERVWTMSGKFVKAFLNHEDRDRWEVWKIAEKTTFMFCPNPRCSELVEMPHPSDDLQCGSCPRCSSLICARCRVLWHGDMTCLEYRSTLTAMTDPQLRSLVKKQKWCLCPNCNIIVEKIAGCRHMRCICKWEFCYKCGSDWDTQNRYCGASPPCRVYDDDDGRRRR